MANKTASIRYVEDKNGDVFFPVTHQRGVVDSDGTNLETTLSGKQDTLVSGTSIKTINGSSILGSGDIQVQTEITMDNVPTSGSNNPVKSGGLYTELAEKIRSQDIDNVVELTLAQYNALATKDARTMYIISDSTIASDHVGVASLVQTTTSTEDGGTNVWTCTLTNGQSFTLEVKNGNQGNSGYSGAAGELEVVNNVTHGGATAALSAEMGKQLEGEISQLGRETTVADVITLSPTAARNLSPESNGTVGTSRNGYSYILPVKSGEVLHLAFTITTGYYRRGFTTVYPVGGATLTNYFVGNTTVTSDNITAPYDGYLLVESNAEWAPTITTPNENSIGRDVFDLKSTVNNLEADVEELQDATHVEVTKNGTVIAGKVYTLTVGSAPTEGSSSWYKAVRAQGLVKGDTIQIRAKAGSSYPTWAKVLNGSVVWASANNADVDTTVTCDGTFDEIITNSYSSYVASPYAIITHQAGVVELIGEGDELRVLLVGNSFSEDSAGYIPGIIKNLCPTVKLTLGIAYMGGSNLAQHLAYFSGNDVTLDGKTYKTVNGQYQRIDVSSGTVEFTGLYTFYKSVDGGAWTSQSLTVQQFLDEENWDIITFQQSGNSADATWGTYYAPYIYALHKNLYSKVTYPTRLGWVLVHGAYGNDHAANLTKWEGGATNAEKVMRETGSSILIPYGTAIQNLRTTSLASLGDGSAHDLLVDTAHLQDGIGPLAAAFTYVLAIMRAKGLPGGVIGDNTRPDATFLSTYNVPGQNVGTGMIGITAANCLLAQIAAEKAVMNPYEVTDLSVYQ